MVIKPQIGGGVGPIVLTVNNSGEILTRSISSIAAIAGDRVTVTNTGSISGLTGSVGIEGATSADRRQLRRDQWGLCRHRRRRC